MNRFLFIQAVLVVLIFATTVVLVIRSNPPGSPARARRPLVYWHTMVLTALIAFSFAILPAKLAGILSIALFLLVVFPFPLLWQALELATTACWVPVTIMQFSDISFNFARGIVVLVIGAALGLSWILRTCVHWMKPGSRSDWASLLLVPAAAVLFFILVPTGWAFRARLAASESALLAFARNIPSGFQQSYHPEPLRVGLFWAFEVQKREGCVLWTTGGFITVSEGLAYVPRRMPPAWTDHRFEPISGPWWRFWH